jgi:hypothetical protein
VKLVAVLEDARELDTPTLERELLELATGALELAPPTTP